MKNILLLMSFASLQLSGMAQQNQKRVLVFSKTVTYHHQSIPNGIAAIQKLGAENGFGVDTTTNNALFTDDNLKKYAAVVFLSPSGNVLDTAQQISFKRYIEAGGGYIGIHAASTTNKNWAWYGQLVGAVFTDHPKEQKGIVIVADKNNAATKHLPTRWQRVDEWYNFRQIPTGVHVLLTADETTYEGGKHGKYHPLAWYHEFDGGRAFYTAIGHRAESYTDPLYLAHILAGIKYAMSNNVPLDYGKVKTLPYEK
nr:ThuA domain-containing protein [uncultured Mucilaginibacter sp.]